MAPIYSMALDDVNGDGSIDLLIAGNLNAVQPDFGRYDASLGLILLGNGKGEWQPVDAQKTGFFVPGEARSIQVFRNFRKEKIVLVSRNNQSLIGFKTQTP
jgi:hypothetical protein